MIVKSTGGGPFNQPNGQIKVENPDGVSRTFGASDVMNSLTNSSCARGGSDGYSLGAFTQYSRDGTNSSSVIFDPFGNNPDKIKVG